MGRQGRTAVALGSHPGSGGLVHGPKRRADLARGPHHARLGGSAGSAFMAARPLRSRHWGSWGAAPASADRPDGHPPPCGVLLLRLVPSHRQRRPRGGPQARFGGGHPRSAASLGPSGIRARQHRHRAGRAMGIHGARLGRLLGLGPGRNRFYTAVAGAAANRPRQSQARLQRGFGCTRRRPDCRRACLPRHASDEGKRCLGLGARLRGRRRGHSGR